MIECEDCGHQYETLGEFWAKKNGDCDPICLCPVCHATITRATRSQLEIFNRNGNSKMTAHKMEDAGTMCDSSSKMSGDATKEELLLMISGTSFALRYSQGRGIAFYLLTTQLSRDLSMLVEMGGKQRIDLEEIQEALIR